MLCKGDNLTLDIQTQDWHIRIDFIAKELNSSLVCPRP